jgi:DNA-binding response OmpR family regulator
MLPDARKLRVLVVDDEEVLRVMLLRMLSKAGYEVLLAASAEMALEILEGDASVDVLLTDVRLPGLSGPDLCRRLGRHAPPTILFMSGASFESPDALLRLGGSAFVHKPFRVAELLGTLEAATSARGRSLAR